MHSVIPLKLQKALESRSNVPRSPALGGAILAAVGCGEYESVEAAADKLVKIVDTVEPEAELVEKYEKRYQEFRQIYPALKPVFPHIQ